MKSIRYAILFKTHVWDDFVRRQVERLRARIGDGDIYLYLDESNGALGPIDFPRIIRAHVRDLPALGVAAMSAQGDPLRYNGDYPLYQLRQLQPGYAYYATIEYDAVINHDLDLLVEKLAARGVDFAGLLSRQSMREWYWGPLYREFYSFEEMRSALICIAFCSGRALDFLLEARREWTRRNRETPFRYWPSSEAFIPTELVRAGFVVADLREFGSTRAYDWWPPRHEDELEKLRGESFIHPVLEGQRYLASTLSREMRPLLKVFLPGTTLWRKLRRYPLWQRARMVRRRMREVRRKVSRETFINPESRNKVG